VPQSFKLSALSVADAAHERSNFRFRHLLEKHACSEQMPELVNHRGEGKRNPSSYLARATPLPCTVMGVHDADVNVEHNETKESKRVFHPGAPANGNGRMTKLFHEQRIRTSCCFSKLKHFRRFATQDERSKTCFRGLVALACICINLQLYVATGNGTGGEPCG
jgi:hypothetical protein